MALDVEMKRWIDEASYEALLTKWRFAVAGDLFFQGEMGKYYSVMLGKKREEVGNSIHVTTSKKIGW